MKCLTETIDSMKKDKGFAEMEFLGSAPVFIGGTNGSGTRVVATLLEMAGVFQGTEKNSAFEPEKIIKYTRPMVPELMRQVGAATYDVDLIPEEQRSAMSAWIRTFAQDMRNECPVQFARWGWKHPRNLFLVPLLNDIFRNCYFVQVVRDGRDMSLAANKGDVRALFHYIIGPEDPNMVDCVRFWSHVNSEVADWCESNMGARYVSCRLEDICADPFGELRRLTDALNVSINGSLKKQCEAFVQKPSSLGRWRDHPREFQRQITKVGRKGLVRFGYVAQDAGCPDF